MTPDLKHLAPWVKLTHHQAMGQFVITVEELGHTEQLVTTDTIRCDYLIQQIFAVKRKLIEVARVARALGAS